MIADELRLTHLSYCVICTPSSVSTSLMSNCSVPGSLSRIQAMASAVTCLNCGRNS